MKHFAIPDQHRLQHPTPIAILLALTEVGVEVTDEQWSSAMKRARELCAPFIRRDQ